MYHIITDNEKILEFAKENGAEVLEAPRSIIINVEKNDLKIVPKIREKASEENTFKPRTIDEFLKAFPLLNIKDIRVQYLKYILRNNLGCRKDLIKSIYPRVARRYRVTPEIVRMGIMHVFGDCISNIPKQYKEFFEQYECSVHWTNEYAPDFVKACQEYLLNNNIIF